MRLVTIAGVALAALPSVAACSRSAAPKPVATAGPTAAPAAAAAPAATAMPPLARLAVFVEGPAPTSPGAEVWVKELRTALEARGDEFRLVRREQAALVVRIEGVDAAKDGTHTMRGVFVRGRETKSFNLTYPGEARPQAEALARNLRRFAEQVRSGTPSAH
jgi:hypothetical protein